jgi:hypothetical protein
MQAAAHAEELQGWRKVARTRLPALSDVFVIKLPLGP